MTVDEESAAVRVENVEDARDLAALRIEAIETGDALVLLTGSEQEIDIEGCSCSVDD